MDGQKRCRGCADAISVALIKRLLYYTQTCLVLELNIRSDVDAPGDDVRGRETTADLSSCIKYCIGAYSGRTDGWMDGRTVGRGRRSSVRNGGELEIRIQVG